MTNSDFQGRTLSVRSIQRSPARAWGARSLFFCALALFLLWISPEAHPASTQPAAKAPPQEPAAGAGDFASVEKAWQAHRDFLARGEWEKSRQELEKIYQWKLDQGIRNHYPYSIALLRESLERSRNGNSGAGAELLSYAGRMAPDFSEVPRARAGWFWSRIPDSGENALRAVSAWGEGVWRSFANPEEALPQLAKAAFWVLASFVFAFGGFALFLLCRYHAFFAHHLKHLIRIDLGAVPLRVFGLLVLFCPLFLGLGWVPTVVFWVLVFWVYARKTERRVAVILLLFLLLLPSGVRLHSSLLLSSSGNGVPEILRARTGAWDEDFYRTVLKMNEARPEDRDLLHGLGLLEKRMGKFPEAERRFGEMARLDPRSGPAFTNLGNVYLVTNRLDEAMGAYRKAAELEPTRGEAYYNLGQAYLLKLRMKEAEAEFQKAQELEPQAISYHTSISSRHPNRLVIDRNIDLLQVGRRVLAATPERERMAAGLWGMVGGALPLDYGEGAAAAAFLLLGMVHLFSRRISFLRNCERCGNIICSRCTRSRVMGSQCVQCLNAFSANASSDPGGVKKKRSEVARYQSRVLSFPRRVSLVVPGMGHLIHGYSREGFVLLFIFALFLTQAILRLEGASAPVFLNPGWSWPWVGGIASLFLLFYVLVQYRMGKLRSEGGKSHFRKP